MTYEGRLENSKECIFNLQVSVNGCIVITNCQNVREWSDFRLQSNTLRDDGYHFWTSLVAIGRGHVQVRDRHSASLGTPVHPDIVGLPERS